MYPEDATTDSYKVQNVSYQSNINQVPYEMSGPYLSGSIAKSISNLGSQAVHVGVDGG